MLDYFSKHGSYYVAACLGLAAEVKVSPCLLPPSTTCSCSCCFQAVRVPAPTFTARPRLPRFVHTLSCCLPCSELTACLLAGWAACSATPATRPTINSCPITFDFHFRHSLLEHHQPSCLFHPPSPGHISLHLRTSLRLTSKSKRLSRRSLGEEECGTGKCVKRVSAVGRTGSKTGLRFGGRAILRRREACRATDPAPRLRTPSQLPDNC